MSIGASVSYILADTTLSGISAQAPSRYLALQSVGQSFWACKGGVLLVIHSGGKDLVDGVEDKHVECKHPRNRPSFKLLSTLRFLPTRLAKIGVSLPTSSSRLILCRVQQGVSRRHDDATT